jgi:RNA polymerase sigma-70 factor (ECF subfamily)
VTESGRAHEAATRALADALAEQRLRIVASLIRTTGDWDLAEDAVADAAERALRRWPGDGVPASPAAWLTTTARRRAVDLLRRANTERTKLAEVALMDDLSGSSHPTEPFPVNDDRLRLVFTCCHPALPLEGRVALTCKVVAGLSTDAVARAFLVSEATMGQRLLRAK